MRYKPEWKGRLRVGEWGDVHWDDKQVGHVVRRFKDGARSPGGMKTDTVFVASRLGDEKTETAFASMTLAIESLIPRRKRKMGDVKVRDTDGDRLMDVAARFTFVVTKDAGAEAVDPTQLKLELKRGRPTLIDGAGDDRSVIADYACVLNIDVICSNEQGKTDLLENALRSLSRCAFVLRKITEGDHKALENAQDASNEAVQILLDIGRRDLWDEEPGDDDEEDPHAPVLGGEGG